MAHAAVPEHVASPSAVLVPGLRAVRRRLRPHPMLVQLLRYTVVGGAGTALNVVLFLVARLWWDAVPANLVAIVLSTLITTEVNRRFTFSSARSRHWRTALQNVGTIVFYATYGAGVLMLLAAMVQRPSTLLEAMAVAVASIFGGIARFAVLRLWAFAPPMRRRAAGRSAERPA